MELKERLEYCKNCQKRKFGDTGIICSLTERKPDFDPKCSDFLLDPKEVKRKTSKVEYSDHEKKGQKRTIWGILVIGLIVIRIILRLMKD